MAHRPRRSQHANRPSARGEDFTALTSEVLKLRLQALNLPIVGSRGQLLARLKRALPGKATTAPNPRKRRTTTVKTRQLGRPKKKSATNRTAGEPATRPASPVDEDEDSALSDNASFSSIEEMIESGPEPVAFGSQSTTVFSPDQRSAIEDLVSESIRSALSTFQTSSAAHPPSSPNENCCTPGMASPLGLSRPLDQSLEDKIRRGEYIDFALLLPDNLYQSQTPEIQLRLDDSSSGPMGSPVTMVRKKKPVIDTFPKWLDAYMAYMIVLVSAYPRRALELIKYQQIISRAVTKFKGLAWLSYDQQFRRRAAYNLSLRWDKVDLELWTVTFAGLAKPHCNVCSSPYHAEDVCPSADLNRRPRRPQTVCFDFNKPSGCRRRNCSYPHVCRRCHSTNHAAPDCPQQQPNNASRSTKPSERGKK